MEKLGKLEMIRRSYTFAYAVKGQFAKPLAALPVSTTGDDGLAAARSGSVALMPVSPATQAALWDL